MDGKEFNGLINGNYILNSIRILILINEFKNKKSVLLDIDKIMLFDYYMKFPNSFETETTKQDFDDEYSYFHWQPNRDEYFIYINYLYSKGLIDKKLINNKYFYTINILSEEILNSFNSDYYFKLKSVALEIKRKSSSITYKYLDQKIVVRCTI